KTRFFLLAIPCLLIAACTSSADKATKQKADSLAAVAHMDSMLNASKTMHTQDSIDAAKKDTTKKADTTKVQK
ncbi:MAG TPA: hypothetical protein VK809_10065, partial [Bacteroidia bacterium]|nr:hypothetical protein [Bacteroidia bacterium]